jgi:non-ribosomal peptide synthetase component E (peptide arylation enzyme)
VSDELIAYIVQRDPRNDRSDEIRQFLADRLPAHYMPAQIVTLAALPLTADGRIDRSELPERPQKNNAASGSGVGQ